VVGGRPVAVGAELGAGEGAGLLSPSGLPEHHGDAAVRRSH
jgi:hypothetical protein